MESVTTKKGQVVIPKPLRVKYHIKPGTVIQWIDTGSGIKLVAIPNDTIDAIRGCAKGENLTTTLLKNRKEDKAVEH
jgi:AbrB family looped-hinge helix DNA binding protein